MNQSTNDNSVNFTGWLIELDKTAYALKHGDISPLEWQDNIDTLFKKVDINTLLNHIDFENIKNDPDVEIARNKEQFFDVSFLSSHVSSDKMNTITKIAKVAKGHSIIPHAHTNMVSAFLTISGEFHIRQFDRIYIDDDYLHIRPVTDYYSRPGQWCSQSDQRNNIHWLTAMSDDAYLFSAKVININPNDSCSGRIYIDPKGQDIGEGIIKVRRLDYEQAYDRYG